MKFNHTITAVALAAFFSANASSAAVEPAIGSTQLAQAAAAAPQTDGEVRKVDKEQGKLTLRHGPLQNLDMPAMTMVFRVADPKMLEALKEGDKVKFTAEKVNGAFTVTAIQPAR